MDVIQQITNQIEKQEDQFSQYACKSKESIRLKREIDEINVRLPFARDTDRIIHCNAYSRYIDKTQVFSETANDNITRRILHVELVNKIGRTIGKALNLNIDLIEAICVGHDIGHTPLGHFGEQVLNEISLRETGTLFRHNLQGVRTMMDIERSGEGCNLSIQVLDGILCHNGLLTNDNYQPIPKTVDSFLNEYQSCYHDKTKLKQLVPMTLEGCVARYSDIIAYIGKDIEDAIQLGVFSRHQIPNEIKVLLGDNNGTIVDIMVHDLIRNSYGLPYLKFSDQIYDALIKLRQFNFEHIYNQSLTEDQRANYRIQFEKLYTLYKQHIEDNDPNSPIKQYLSTMSQDYKSQTSPERQVIDFLAGMTDRFFLNQYKLYFGGN